LFSPSLASYPQKPFLAFTDVLRKIFGSLTRKVWEFLADDGFPPSSAADITDHSPGKRKLDCSITFPLLAAVRFLSKKSRHAGESVTAGCELRLFA
jgi:hypothetical protein